MDLKDTLQSYRKRQGLSQIDLADALEVSRQTVSKWETGAVLPSAENLLALSKLYGVTVDTLLNEAMEEPTPELVSLAAEPPAAPPDPALLPRRRLIQRILALLLPLDLLFFFMDVSLFSGAGFITFATLARLLTCCAVGLLFAWLDRRSPVNRRTSLLIGGAALILGLYVLLMPPPSLWRLYDFIGGGSTPWDVPLPNPVRLFAAWTLCDSYAAFAHMLLITAFQLGRLGFSRREPRLTYPQPSPHA